MPDDSSSTLSQAVEVSNSGLASVEADARLKQFGPNDPAPSRRRPLFSELLLLFVNPLVIILLIAAALSGVIGQVLDAGIIAGMVLIGVSINFYQTYRSKSAIESLRARVARDHCLLGFQPKATYSNVYAQVDAVRATQLPTHPLEFPVNGNWAGDGFADDCALRHIF